MIKKPKYRKSNNLKKQVYQKLVGHNDAVDSIFNMYDGYMANLNDDQRPICSSLLVGPTG